MIDKQAFAEEWRRMCKRFNRELDPEEANDFYRYLSPQMDTETFQEASQRLWAAREFFPRPDDWVEASRVSCEALAASEWELCQWVMRGDLKALARMSDTGRRTIRLMGGVDALRNSKVDEAHYRRAEFLRLYPTADEVERRESGTALPAWTEEGARKLKEALPKLRLIEGGGS